MLLEVKRPKGIGGILTPGSISGALSPHLVREIDSPNLSMKPELSAKGFLSMGGTSPNGMISTCHKCSTRSSWLS